MEHRISSPYHPQTNGLDERMNQTLVHTLIKMANSEDQWDKNIDAALYAYRISMQDSTRFSPFFLLYNCHPRKAIQHAVDSSTVEPTSMSDDENMTDIEEVMGRMVDARREYHEKALNNIRRAQERQKCYYDAKHDSNHVSDVNNVLLCKHNFVYFINIKCSDLFSISELG